MSTSTDVNKIFNDGERLVPLLTHNDDELIRHYSSHNFFRNIINKDTSRLNLNSLSILDVGFGAGYASYVYSKLSQVSKVKGIDVSEDSLVWSKENFCSPKINYELCNAIDFLSRREKYSYIVTRHVLEHIKDGLNIVKENKYTNRLCINVPYNEGDGNEFHVVKRINESLFPKYENVEFFYEDLHGNTYKNKPDSIFINSIVFIASKKGMPKVESYFKFPLKAPKLDDIIADLTYENTNFVKNIIHIQSQRLKSCKSKIMSLENGRSELMDKCSGLLQENAHFKKRASRNI